MEDGGETLVPRDEPLNVRNTVAKEVRTGLDAIMKTSTELVQFSTGEISMKDVAQFVLNGLESGRIFFAVDQRYEKETLDAEIDVDVTNWYPPHIREEKKKAEEDTSSMRQMKLTAYPSDEELEKLNRTDVTYVARVIAMRVSASFKARDLNTRQEELVQLFRKDFLHMVNPMLKPQKELFHELTPEGKEKIYVGRVTVQHTAPLPDPALGQFPSLKK